MRADRAVGFYQIRLQGRAVAENCLAKDGYKLLFQPGQTTELEFLPLQLSTQFHETLCKFQLLSLLALIWRMQSLRIRDSD